MSPVCELGFNGESDIVQAGKVTVMNTEPTSEFPDALRGVQFRTEGQQEIQAETFRLLLPPIAVQSGVVISGVVGNHYHLSIRASAAATKLFQELPAG
jgi:hypothetical protein